MMIIIRAEHDIQTSYLYAYSEELIEEAEKKGLKVVKLEGNDITLANLRGKIKHSQPKFIFFNGHGSTNSLFKNMEEEFVTIDSADVFKGTVSYTIACNCLESLGSEAVRQGCRAFIGYNKPFWIAREHKSESRPLEDKVAKPIMECSNIVVKSLIKGNSVEESIKKSHQKAHDNVIKLIYSKEPLAAASLQALVANDGALDFKGEGSAKII